MAACVLCFAACGNNTGGEDNSNSGGKEDNTFQPTDPNAESMTLKVMSFNIRCYKYTDPDMDGTNKWDLRKVAFAPMIEEHRPAVVGMQEARPDQMLYLDGVWSGYKRIGIGRRTGTNVDERNDEYVPVFYDKNQVQLESESSWGTFWLSDTPDHFSMYEGSGSPRIATWAVFIDRTSGQKFFFVNTHIDINGEDKTVPVRQMVVLRNQIDKLNKEKLPFMVTADFNKTLDDPIYIWEPFEDLVNVRTALEGDATDNTPTYQNWGKHPTGLIVDHIYCSKDMDPVKYIVIDEKYKDVPYISDHYPIMGTLNYKIGKK